MWRTVARCHDTPEAGAVKPAPFELARPATVEEALALLAEHGDGAAVLAGGQSLLLDLRYRTLTPRVVVDIGRLRELDVVRDDGTALHLGALARHRVLEDARAAGVDDVLADVAARAAAHVGHPPIRRRGTVVGSLAWAEPVAEWGALAVLTGAVLHVASTRGRRRVAAEDWFRGPHRTAREPDELVTGVDLPHLAAAAPEGTTVRAAFGEARRTSASFALVAVFTAVATGEDGRVAAARIAVAGAGGVPLRMSAAEAALAGRRLDDAALADAGAAAAASADPVDEPHASAAYRRHVVDVLVRRTLGATARSEAVMEAA
jgi:carbon-monoxide dehydrogenase medium subunit